MVERDQLVALIGERRPGLLEIGRYLLGTVVDVAGADQLVAGVVEGLDRGVVVVPVLRLHVLDHKGLARCPQPRAMLGANRHRL
jgi:hypothetical protein